MGPSASDSSCGAASVAAVSAAELAAFVRLTHVQEIRLQYVESLMGLTPGQLPLAAPPDDEAHLTTGLEKSLDNVWAALGEVKRFRME